MLRSRTPRFSRRFLRESKYTVQPETKKELTNIILDTIEKEQKYFDIAKERIENFESLMITDW